MPEQWDKIERDLLAARPVDVFVAMNKHEQLAACHPGMLDLLSKHYHAVRHSANGTWHELTDATVVDATVVDATVVDAASVGIPKTCP